MQFGNALQNPDLIRRARAAARQQERAARAGRDRITRHIHWMT
jgi:hypothetical protein